MLWYTIRDGGGNLIGLRRWPSPGDVEQIDDQSPEAVTFLTRRVKRTMYAIASDIFALSGTLPTPAANTQKGKLITDLFSGNLATGSQKWQQDAGPNAAALSAVYAAITQSNGLATFNGAQQLIMAAMYTQDNIGYLVNPAFDPTINIPGDMPAV